MSCEIEREEPKGKKMDLSGATMKALLGRSTTSLADVTKHLGETPHDRRIAECRELGKAEQARLWEIAEGKGEPLTLDYLVHPNAKPLVAFPFEGKNSLPAFTRFQKVFYRQEDGVIGGMNRQAISAITGPGYYVAEMSALNPAEIGVNYLKVPTEKPAAWPPIQRNEAGANLSRFIYANMIDYLRWVSKDVVIGRAYRAGTKPMPNWFILCRAVER